MNLSNFGSLFPFRTNMHSTITTLLEDPNITLQKLLDQDTSFLNDFKTQNPKLMQFMTYDKYKTLLEYVTKVGPEDQQKRSYKYPFVACDVLTTETNSPAEFILPEKEIFVEEEVMEEVEVEEQTEGEELPVIEGDEELPSLESPEGEQPEDPPVVRKTEENGNQQMEVEQVGEEDKPKNKILVKKQVVRKVKRQVPALISDLFGYLDEEINFTLAGYFSRILTTLFSKKPTSLSAYFFGDLKNTRILDHSQSRSITDIIIKFLTVDSLSFLPQRQHLLQQILTRLSLKSNPNSLGNLSLVLCEVIDKYSSTVKTLQGAKEMLEYIYGEKFCQLLLKSVLSEDEEVSVHCAPVLLCSLVSIRSLIDSKEQSKTAELVDRYQELMTFLRDSLADSSEMGVRFRGFFTKAVAKLNLTRRTSPTLGMGRIKLLQSLFFLVKFDFYNIQMSVPESQFFQRLLQLVREYDLNNVLHNEVVKVLTFVLELEQPNALVTSLFDEAKLLDFLYEETTKNQELQARIANKERGVSRKGYIGHIVKIGQLLLKTSGSEQVFAYLSDDRWNKVRELVEKETFETEKNLAGYTTKKDDANLVMFQKQQILAKHQAFLSQPPPEPDLPDPLEDTIAMIEKRLNLEIPAEQKQPQVIQPDNKDSQDPLATVNYWKNARTLKYEINDLLLQLSD